VQSSQTTSAEGTQQFTEWLLNASNGAGFCLMASIGNRCGLFNVTSGTPPATAQQIARLSA
jgi:hypothetical protein